MRMKRRRGVDDEVPGLRRALALNGAVFVLRGVLNVARPTSFYVPAGAPAYATDTARVVGLAFLGLAVAQIGVARSGDQASVRVVAAGSLGLAAGLAGLAVTTRPDGGAAFHRLRVPSAVENAGVSAAYAGLLARSHRRRDAQR